LSNRDYEQYLTLGGFFTEFGASDSIIQDIYNSASTYGKDFEKDVSKIFNRNQVIDSDKKAANVLHAYGDAVDHSVKLMKRKNNVF
jgi:hypothetical protein